MPMCCASIGWLLWLGYTAAQCMWALANMALGGDDYRMLIIAKGALRPLLLQFRCGFADVGLV